MHIQRLIHAHESIKLNPNHSSCLSYQSAIPSKAPHDCPTPYIPLSCCTKVPPWLFQIHPWAEQSTYAPGFLSTLPCQCGEHSHCSPEENARFSNKSKKTFLEITISKLRTVWFLWSPLQEMEVRGRESF